MRLLILPLLIGCTQADLTPTAPEKAPAPGTKTPDTETKAPEETKVPAEINFTLKSADTLKGGCSAEYLTSPSTFTIKDTGTYWDVLKLKFDSNQDYVDVKNTNQTCVHMSIDGGCDGYLYQEDLVVIEWASNKPTKIIIEEYRLISRNWGVRDQNSVEYDCKYNYFSDSN